MAGEQQRGAGGEGGTEEGEESKASRRAGKLEAGHHGERQG